MVRQAEEFADKDKERARVVEVRNRGESLAYEAERVLEENGSKIPESDAAEIRAKVKELRSALAEKEPSGLDDRIADLTKALHRVAQMLYETASKNPPTDEGGTSGATSSGPSGGSTSGPRPVDADFKVVDKETGEEKGPS